MHSVSRSPDLSSIPLRCLSPPADLRHPRAVHIGVEDGKTIVSAASCRTRNGRPSPGSPSSAISLPRHALQTHPEHQGQNRAPHLPHPPRRPPARRPRHVPRRGTGPQAHPNAALSGFSRPHAQHGTRWLHETPRHPPPRIPPPSRPRSPPPNDSHLPQNPATHPDNLPPRGRLSDFPAKPRRFRRTRPRQTRRRASDRVDLHTDPATLTTLRPTTSRTSAKPSFSTTPPTVTSLPPSPTSNPTPTPAPHSSTNAPPPAKTTSTTPRASSPPASTTAYSSTTPSPPTTATAGPSSSPPHTPPNPSPSSSSPSPKNSLNAYQQE